MNAEIKAGPCTCPHPPGRPQPSTGATVLSSLCPVHGEKANPAAWNPPIKRKKILTRFAHALPDGRVITRESGRPFTHVIVARDAAAGTWWLAQWCQNETSARKKAKPMRQYSSAVEVEPINHGVRS